MGAAWLREMEVLGSVPTEGGAGSGELVSVETRAGPWSGDAWREGPGASLSVSLTFPGHTGHPWPRDTLSGQAWPGSSAAHRAGAMHKGSSRDPGASSQPLA